MPATMALSGMLCVTTEFAPTITLFPILTLPITLLPANNVTLSPIVGTPALAPECTRPTY